jgi:hypothetical protein
MSERWPRGPAPHRRSPSWRPEPFEGLPSGRAVRLAGVGLVLVVLIAAVLWPNAADGLLRLLLVTLAIGYIGRRGFDALPPLAEERGSPFGREPMPDRPPAAPRPLYDLLRQLRSAYGGAGGSARAIPPPICRTLREEAERRLAEGHRLDAAKAADHIRIRALVTHATWRLIEPLPCHGAPLPRRIPLSQLDSILDDLEKL